MTDPSQTQFYLWLVVVIVVVVVEQKLPECSTNPSQKLIAEKLKQIKFPFKHLWSLSSFFGPEARILKKCIKI